MNKKTGFQIELDNYAYGVRTLIPGYLTGKMQDTEAFKDELGAILWARDYLEKHLPDQSNAEEARRQIDELDRLLLLSKDALLQKAPFYTFFRQGKDIPRTRWWYYLDLVTRAVVEAYTLPAADMSARTVLLPERITAGHFIIGERA